MASEIKVDTISEKTSAGGVTIDGLLIKDGGISGDVSLIGTTPTFTIGDAGAEDAALIFDGNAQDFYIALDDSADDLIIGLGNTVGTTPMLSFDENKIATFADDIIIGDGKTIGSASDVDAITIASNGQLTLTQTLIGTALDISGDIDVDGTSNLDVVDIDGAVDMASTLAVAGVTTITNTLHVNKTAAGDAVSFKTTEASSSAGPLLLLNRDSSSPADGDLLGQIRFLGKNEDGSVPNYVTIQASIVDATAASLDSGFFINTWSAGVEQSIFEFTGTETVINEDSKDLDFRVESDGYTHALFVDAGNDRVGIGTNAVDTGGKCLTVKAMGSAGPQLILHQYNAADGWEFNAEDATGHFTIADSTAEEMLRIVHTGQLATGGETAADVGAGGLCLDQNAIDTNIMTFKSSDVAHGITGNAETDTYAEIGKASGGEGGLLIQGYAEGDNDAFVLATCTVSAPPSANSTSAGACIRIDGAQKSGTGRGGIAAGDNILVVGNNDTTEFIIKGDGELYSNQSATVQTFDSYEDAQLVRALDLSRDKNLAGVINSKFDDYIKYNHETLANAKLVGREEDGTPNHFVNVTGMQRLHNGAIWQQYEKHERLLEAVYDLAKEAVGEDKANAILDKHEVKRLQ